MGDVARCSLEREELLYQLFGVNAELLIDHAWGWEPTTIADIKAYKPQSNSIGSGQVLHCPYPYDKTKLVVWEMADQLSLDLVDKGLVTDQVVLTVGYDMENLKDAYQDYRVVDVEQVTRKKFYIYSERDDAFLTQYRCLVLQTEDGWKIDKNERLMDGKWRFDRLD